VIKEQNSDFQVFDYKNFKDLKITLLGTHQIYNASLAVEVIQKLKNIYGYRIEEEAIKRGLMSAKWPGRLEVMKKRPYVVIDGAHNPQGMTVLKESLKLFNYRRLILVIGMLKDKEVNKMLNIITPVADVIITTTPLSDRAYSAKDLASKISRNSVFAVDQIDKAVNEALKMAGEEDMVLFCGSLYMIGHVRKLLRGVLNKK
ncbi:MAG: Folylpolyglutamate synthase, partial [Caldanaerobacter subterraneus]